MDTKAKQLKPISLNEVKGGPEYTQASQTETGRKVPLKKGENPKGAMVDGPFGGKRPA